MKKISLLLVAAMTICGALPAAAADANVRTCALNKVMQCTPDEGCSEWTVQDMELPRFVKVDLKAKTLTSLDKQINRTSAIQSVEQTKQMVILHGTELRGWTMSITADGDLTLSAAGDSEGFIVFGSCINQ